MRQIAKRLPQQSVEPLPAPSWSMLDRDTRAEVEAFPVDQTCQAAITTLLQTSTRGYVLAQPELDLASGAGSTVLRRER
jgi:hypothetical protein